MNDSVFDTLQETSANDPQAVVRAAAARRRRPLLGSDGRLMLVAADHPARGALGVGGRGGVMADRYELLQRLLSALERKAANHNIEQADAFLSKPVSGERLVGCIEELLARKSD